MLDSVRGFFHRATTAWTEAVKRHRDIEVLDTAFHRRHRAEERYALDEDACVGTKSAPPPSHRRPAPRHPRVQPEAETRPAAPAAKQHLLAVTPAPQSRLWYETENSSASSRRLLGATSPLASSYMEGPSSSSTLSSGGGQTSSSTGGGVIKSRTFTAFGAGTVVARHLAQQGRGALARQPPTGGDRSDFFLERTMTLNSSLGGDGDHAAPTLYDRHHDSLDAASKAVLPVYRAALAGGIAAALYQIAQRRVGELQGGFRAAVRAVVVDMASKKCPPPKGVIKALKAPPGRTYTVPLALDAVDEKALANVAAREPSAVLVTLHGFNITALQLRTLEGRSWLNDQVINTYCRMVQDSFPTVCTLGSFLLEKLAKGGATQDALRWTNAFDVFGFDKIMVVHNNGVHWTLAVVNIAQRRFEYYDSMGGTGERPLALLVEYMEEEWRLKQELVGAKRRLDAIGGNDSSITPKQLKRILVKGSTPGPDTPPSQWGRYTPGSRVPQQRNSDDCGVFTCQFCYHVAAGLPLDAVSQNDMPFYRKLMMLELLEGRLLPRC